MRSTTQWLLLALLHGPMVSTAAAAVTAPAPTPMEQAVERHQRGDLVGARQAFERLSRQGVPAADYNLAVMHLHKELPDASPQEGLRLMARAAERGFVTAMIGLAQLHERGEVDGKRDLAAAHGWFRRAAEAGNVDAQVEVATAHYLGRGTARDPAAAAHWYREAAKGGDAGAQYLLASMYETGLGVERDLRLARYWYDICARNGDIAAPAKVKELDARLANGPSGPQ